MCLFLALASKTPARTEDDVLDKMMDHAQSICPTGMGPYGRMTETFTFEPNRECGEPTRPPWPVLHCFPHLRRTGTVHQKQPHHVR